MTHHSELINWLLQARGLKSYLEIGTFNKDHNFNKIQALVKTCVDPDPKANANYQMTSDEFFAQNRNRFDVIFIDGFHTGEQVQKDFDNSLQVLSPNGFIVLHDCNPHKESITHVPRDSGEWCGDVFKFACTLKDYKGIKFRTIDMDYCCCVVWKDLEFVDVIESPELSKITYEEFDMRRYSLLQLTPVEALWTLFTS